MGNRTKWTKICIKFTRKKLGYSNNTSDYKKQYNTFWKHGQIFRNDPKCWIEIERICEEQTKRAWNRIQESIFVTGKKFSVVSTQQNDNI